MQDRFFHILKNPYITFPLLWLLAAIIINPIGDFPLNDDWSYSKNVYNLSVKNRFVVDPWPAMNLFSQTIYGTIVCKIFGFSFTALRLSILLLGILSSIYLYKIVLFLSNNQSQISFLVVTGFCFSTLYCSLSFSFMTDVFFLSFLIFAIYQLQLYSQKKHWLNYLLFVLFCVIAVLNRQHGVLIPFLLVGVVFYHHRFSLVSIFLAAFPIVMTWLAHDKYRHYLTWFGIGHNLQNTDKLWKYLQNARFEDIHAHAGDLFLTTGFIILPLIIILVLTQFPKFNIGSLIALGICALISTLVVWQDWHLYPQGNVSGGFEIGPRVLKVDPINVPSSSAFWWQMLSKFIAFCSATFCLYYLLNKFFAKSTSKYFRTVYFPFILIGGVYFIFISVNEAYFDRYSLPLSVIVLVLLVPSLQTTLTTKTKWLIYGVVALIFLTSAFETRDFFNWQKKRWSAIDYLHKNKKLTSSQIDGGFEYNGWYTKTNIFSEPPKSWWWVEDDKYIVAKSRLKNYSVDTILVNTRWLPFGYTDSIFVLQREE